MGYGESQYNTANYRAASIAAKEEHQRKNFTQEQVVALEIVYENSRYPDRSDKEKLSMDLNLSDSQVQTWFSNRRAKSRR
ncbi:hypothetical protein CAPTEDRAFT_99354, partial [Capitella teleta]